MFDAVFSPNRQYKVSFNSYEMRMSHWIDQPSLIRVQDELCYETRAKANFWSNFTPLLATAKH